MGSSASLSVHEEETAFPAVHINGVMKDEEEKLQDKDEKKKDQLLKSLNTVITRICEMSSLFDEDGSLKKDLLNCFVDIFNIHCAIGKINPSAYDVVKKFQCEAGQRLSETKVISLMCCIVIRIWESCNIVEEESIDMHSLGILQQTLRPLWNYSDCTPDVTRDIAEESYFLETLKEILLVYVRKFQSEKVVTEDEGWLIQAVLSIFQNTSSVDSNCIRLRRLDINNVLESYLDSDDDEYRFTALATLANIINENECSILQGRKEIVEFFLNLFDTALKSPEHSSGGGRVSWSAQEFASTVRHLARNDANKKVLVGSLRHLAELAESGTVAEKIEAVSAVWSLSFDKENQKSIVDNKTPNIIELLSKLKDDGEDMSIKRAAEGTFWNLKDELQNRNTKIFVKWNEKWKKAIAATALLRRRRKNDNVKRIMISYSWKNQQELLKIWNLLKLKGYSVWMDIENMSGSIIEAMAEAVESAHVVLVCMSQKYKDSDNCRAEAEYAFKKKKCIVPLNMETDYEPDGWLGLIIGCKLRFDFSGKYEFDNKFNGLLKELAIHFEKTDSENKPKSVIREVAKDTVDAAPVIVTSGNVSYHSIHTKSLSLARKWTQDDVDKWVLKYNLPREVFGHLKGRDLAALVAMKVEAPDCFYNWLQKNLKLNSLSMIDMFLEALSGIK